MLKKTVIFFCAIFISTAYAETCPSVVEIKKDNFHGWQALNIDSAEPVSLAELKKFKRSVKDFSSAQWLSDAPEGAGQCYYRYTDDIANVYFAKDTLKPEASQSGWHEAGWGDLKCEINLTACQFPG